jgi:hypothetical protein
VKVIGPDDLVILGYAVSAGIHGALVRQHFEEGNGAGLGFVVATVVLALLALVLTNATDATGAARDRSRLRRADLRLRAGDLDRRARPAPRAGDDRGAGLLAVLSALAALLVSNGMDAAQAHGDTPAQAPVRTSMAAHFSQKVSAKAVALLTGMRKLWEDHITWTRLAIISLESGLHDTDATVARLLQNQTDIGDAVKPFYGDAAGNELTSELRQHILIAADMIAAAKAGDAAKLADAQARWQQNADEIAALLNRLNPRFWKLDVMKAEMHMHLQLTTEEAVDHLQGDWTADVAAYDKVHDHILHMSDLLANGIIEQFPHQFH